MSNTYTYKVILGVNRVFAPYDEDAGLYVVPLELEHSSQVRVIGFNVIEHNETAQVDIEVKHFLTEDDDAPEAPTPES